MTRRFLFALAPLVLLCSPSFGQSLTYPARVDNCVTGAESGCVFGATTGQAGSPMSFRYRPADTPPFPDITTGNANANATATDPDFNSYLVLATDEHTSEVCLGAASGTGFNASWSMASAGNYDAFSLDRKLLLVQNQNGNECILQLNPTSIHNKTCGTTACVTPVALLGTAGTGHLLTGTAYSFSINQTAGETNVIYELATNVQQVNKVVVCLSSSDPNGCSGQGSFPSVIRTAYVDMNNVNTNVCGSDMLQQFGNMTAMNGPTIGQSPWNSTFSMGQDGTVAWATGQAQDWQASWTPTVNESFILPTVNNTSKDAFQVIAVTGPTSTSEPNWDSSCSSTCTDGGVTYSNIGTIGGQGPGYLLMIYKPGNGCRLINTRVGKIYNSSNAHYTAGAFSTTDAVACSRYGLSTNPCTFPDLTTVHDINLLATGRYIAIGPTGAEGANPSSNWNFGTLSSQISNAVWAGSAAGGSINGGVYSGTATYAAHDVVSANGYFYTALSSTTGNAPPTPPTLSNTYWAQTESSNLNIYDTTSNVVYPCTDYEHCNGHEVMGAVSNWFGDRFRQSYHVNGIVQGLMTPGTFLLAASYPCDEHGSYRNSSSTDAAPPFSFTTCVPMSGQTYTSAYYGEVIAMASGGPVGGVYTAYRFAHAFAGPSPFFSNQNNIGVVSPQGDLVAWGTDMWGRRGDQSANNITCANKNFGTYKPGGGLTLLTNDSTNSNLPDSVFPLTNTQLIYVTTTQGTGTTTSATPTWCTTVGCTVTYPTTGTSAVLTAVANTCRADVVIGDALNANQGASSNSAPLPTILAGVHP